MKRILFASLFLVGCAAHSSDSARTQFPSRKSDARIPAADKLATEIVREHKGLVTSKVRLCVATDGAVDGVTLLSSSGLDAYDQAVLASVQDWQYETPTERTCEKLDVSYRTP